MWLCPSPSLSLSLVACWPRKIAGAACIINKSEGPGIDLGVNLLCAVDRDSCGIIILSGGGWTLLFFYFILFGGIVILNAALHFVRGEVVILVELSRETLYKQGVL